MTFLTNAPAMIIGFDVAIVYIERYLDMLNRCEVQSFHSEELRTKALGAAFVMKTMVGENTVVTPALDQPAVMSIQRACAVIEDWLVDKEINEERLREIQSHSNKSLDLVLLILKNRMAELTLMNLQSDLTFRLSTKEGKDESAQDIKVSEFFDSVQKAKFIRIPLVMEDVDYWWRITDSKIASSGVIVGLERNTSERERKFCEHFIHVSDFDRMLLSDVDQPEPTILAAFQKQLQESRWIWLPTLEGAQKGHWWAFKKIIGGVDRRMLERNIEPFRSITREFNYENADLTGVLLASECSPESLSEQLTNVINAKYIQPYGEGEWLYVNKSQVRKSPTDTTLKFRATFYIVATSPAGERFDWMVTDEELFYSNTKMSVAMPEALAIVEGERLRDFLDKAGSNKYLTVSQLVKDKTVSVTYSIDGFELDKKEPSKSLIKLSFAGKPVVDGQHTHLVASIVFDRSSKLSFSNEPPDA